MVKVHIVPKNQKEIYLTMLPEDILSRDLMLVGAYDDETGEIAGVLAACAYGGEMEILYIAVTKKHLRRGIGSAMVETLVTGARAMLMESITVKYVKKLETEKQIAKTEDLSRALDPFLEKNGFHSVEASRVYAIKLIRLRHNFSKPEEALSLPFNIQPLKSVTETKWNLLRERIRHVGETYAKKDPDSQGSEDKGPLYMDPGSVDSYDKDVSCLYVNANGEPAGCLLLSKRLDGVYMDYLCMLDDDMQSKKAMISMFEFSYRETIYVYDVACIFYVNTANKSSNDLFSKLAGESKKLYGTAVERIIDI